MKFKEWLNEFTAAGGIPVDTPFNPGNSNIAGIKSKWQATDAREEEDPQMDFLRKRGYGFGFQSFVDRERSRKGIDRNKGVPIRDNRPDMA